MREIKFRAWFPPEEYEEEGGMTVFWLGSPIALWDDVEVMPYTGLKSKSDQEIYEGDIVRHSDYPEYLYVVEFKDGAFGDGRMSFIEAHSEHGVDIGMWEVVGNIHENPELLEQIR